MAAAAAAAAAAGAGPAAAGGPAAGVLAPAVAGVPAWPTYYLGLLRLRIRITDLAESGADGEDGGEDSDEDSDEDGGEDDEDGEDGGDGGGGGGGGGGGRTPEWLRPVGELVSTAADSLTPLVRNLEAALNPDVAAVLAAQLLAAGALVVTVVGRALARLPVDEHLAAVLREALVRVQPDAARRSWRGEGLRVARELIPGMPGFFGLMAGFRGPYDVPVAAGPAAVAGGAGAGGLADAPPESQVLANAASAAAAEMEDEPEVAAPPAPAAAAGGSGTD